MNIKSLTFGPSINYIPAPMPQSLPPFGPSQQPIAQKYQVSITADFDTEIEAKVFAMDVLSIYGYSEKKETT